MTGSIRLGTRASRLALAQANEVAAALRAAHPGLRAEIVTITTSGDRSPDAPIPGLGGKGAFTREIEQALLDHRIDVAVHSLKDLPVAQPAGLVLAAVPRRAEPHDVFVTVSESARARLREGALRVGTSSPRRAAELLRTHPGVTVVPMRGNVPTRLRKLEQGEADALVLAAAGLARLGIAGPPPWIDAIRADLMMPAPGQGAIGLQARAGDAATLALVDTINHPESRACCEAERAFLAAMGGDCALPLGALAIVWSGTLHLRGRVLGADGSLTGEGAVEGSMDEAAALGRALAKLIGTPIAAAAIMPCAASPDPAPARPRAVVTRDEDIDGPLCRALLARGIEPRPLPLVRHAPPEDLAALQRAAADAARYDAVIITSARAADALANAHADGRLPDGAHFVCVGAETAARVHARGGSVDFAAEGASNRALLREWAGVTGIEGKHLFFPRSEQADPAVAASLREAGATVDEITAYRTLPGTDSNRAAVRAILAGGGGAEAVLFASASAAKALEPVVARGGVRVLSIGPGTTEALRARGIIPDAEATERSFDGLAEACRRLLESATP